MIKELLKGKVGHFTLIDPDKQDPDKASEMAEAAERYGSNAIMIGGSTAGHKVTDETAKAIKSCCNLPTILFPSTAAGLSSHSDYIFWMMLMNSRDRRFLVGEQVKAAPKLKGLGVKPIPMGYVVVSTSSKPTMVEKVGDVDKIGDKEADKACAYALCAQYYGMECVYLEAGSGAEKPVAEDMIEKVRSEVDITLVVGGGIRTVKQAKSVVASGADVLVTGTIAEEDPESYKKIIEAVNGG